MRDVIVVGAGPGGSSAAAFLAKADRDVLLLDKAKFPRDKPCGDGWSRRCVNLLQEIGIEEEFFHKAGREIFNIILSSPDGNVCTMSTGATGFNIPRKVFDATVKDAAITCGAEILEEFRVADLLFDDGQVCGVRGRYQDETIELQAKVVIGADGAHSVVGDKLGLCHSKPEHLAYAGRAYYEGVEGLTDTEIHYDETVLPGYVWIFPVGEDVANVGLGTWLPDYNKFKKKMEDVLENFIKNSKIGITRFGQARRISDYLGWRLPTGGQLPRTYADGALLVGDAAGLIDSWSGQGIDQALIAGKLAAKVCGKAIDKNDFSAVFLCEYEKLWKAELGEDYKYGLKLRRTGRSPWKINYLVKKAKQDKELAAIIGGAMGGNRPKKDVLSSRTILKLLRPW